MLPAEDLLAPDAARAMAEEIRLGGGNEVFFVGRVESGRVVEAKVVARGNAHMVPAILQVPAPGDVVLHNHPSGELLPSDADGSIASRLGENSVGFYIVDNEVRRVYPVVYAFQVRDVRPVAEDALVAALQPGGKLAAALGTVEDRPSQRAMLHAVAESFEQNRVAVLEAGTGTGKTFAYLLPALDWALANREKVVVATHTINLQEQIIKKDVQALRAVFGDQFHVALMKGRSNYVSLRRARELEESLTALTDAEEKDEAKALVAWAHRTEDGSRSDLTFQPRHELWERVQSESDNCLRHRCPTFHQCFFYRARRNAVEADLLVANHHLLFVDLAMRARMQDDDAGILPSYQRVILDEAHHVEEVATDYFGQQVTRLGVQRALHRIWRDAGRGAKGAVVALLERIRMTEDLPKFAVETWLYLINAEILPARHQVDSSFRELFDDLHRLARAGEVEAGGSGEVRTLRITADLRGNPAFVRVQETARATLADLQGLLKPGRQFLSKTETFAEEARMLGYLSEFESALNRLEAAGDAVESVLLADSVDQVRWIEVKADNPRVVRLQSAPIDVGALLAEHLFANHKTVTLTSATLAVAGKTDFLRKRTGLDRVRDERIREETFPSPFDFMEQARLFITDDLPSPDQSTYEAALEQALPALLAAAGGRAFVLFTSFRSLQRQYRVAKPWLESMGIRALRQGEAPRDKLLQTFREDTRSVLFGTDSFWEGVDVEGEALSTVILTRLPFRVPTHPVLVARAEAIDAAGGRSFTEYTVPMAVIKFRQGFGRLIRSRSDRGVVIVTDGRIVSKPYGRSFLKSLPPIQTVTASTREVEEHVRNFFAA